MNKILPDKQLKIFLKLVALHSFAVGIGLIILPPVYLEYFGLYGYKTSFFQAQGGVFHFVMCMAYLIAAKYLDKSPGMVHFVIMAKSMAVIFLLTYFVFLESSWMLIASAFGDGIMALIMYLLYRQYLNNIAKH